METFKELITSSDGELLFTADFAHHRVASLAFEYLYVILLVAAGYESNAGLRIVLLYRLHQKSRLKS